MCYKDQSEMGEGVPALFSASATLCHMVGTEGTARELIDFMYSRASKTKAGTNTR